MVARGKFFLYDSIVPALEAGKYTMRLDVDIDTAQGGEASPVAPLKTHLKVTAPRFKLPPDQALLTYPPANSEGAYDARLPQIVLKRRTLPWDRRAAAPGEVFHEQTVEDRTPWLALVIIAEGEGNIVHDAPWTECVTPGVTLTGDVDTPKASYLSVPQSTVTKIFPTVEDLGMLTHVREVNIDDTEAAMGDDDGFLAVVIANRMPQYDQENCKPKAYTACLINLEGQLGALPKPSEPRDFFSMLDLFLSDQVQEFATAIHSGAAVPVAPSPQDRELDVTDRDNMLEAIRRGDVVLHRSQLVDRAGIRSNGSLNVLGSVTNEDVLDGDFSRIKGTPAQQGPVRVASALGGFRVPLDRLIKEKFYRFPLLTSWRFTSVGAGSFETFMRNLDVGLLGTKSPSGHKRPLPPCSVPEEGEGSGEAPVTKLPLEIAETGHVGVPQITRTGEKRDAWYRGPLSPHRLLRNPLADEAQFPVLAHVSDQMRMMTPEGREDVSLAVAFETGRLMAMAQPSFVAALKRWREDAFGAARARQSQAAGLTLKPGIATDRLDVLDLTEFGSAIAGGTVQREIETILVAQLNQNRETAVAQMRPLVDPGLPIDAIAASRPVNVIADGLGLDRDILAKVDNLAGSLEPITALHSVDPPVAALAVGGDEERVDTAKLKQTLSDAVSGLVEQAAGTKRPKFEELRAKPVPKTRADFVRNKDRDLT